MNSPFKFLDSYTKEDRDIFFGREREIEELYHRVFESKIMLVYGVSGSGKSSLIQCGLANKFQETDWLPLVIRRGGNILESMATAVKSASITPQPPDIQTIPQFTKAVRSLYLDHYKPVFFIYDQFEELLIFGKKEEKDSFIQIIKSLTESDLNCRFIFILRKEYLADLSVFEHTIPTLMENRVNIDKMSISNAKQAIEGPCRVAGIALEDGFSDELLERLNPVRTEVELTYLQVYLDRLFRMALSENKGELTGLSFRKEFLQKTGNVSDLLGDFLDEQISNLGEPEKGLGVLKSFVSVKGTKKQLNFDEVYEAMKTFGVIIQKTDLHNLLQTFINIRILQEKNQDDKYELRHDALADKLFDKISQVERERIEIGQLLENAFEKWEKRQILLTKEDLDYIKPHEDLLYLTKEVFDFLEKSKKTVEKERIAKAKAKVRRRNFALMSMVSILIVLTGLTFWAMSERKKAVIEKVNANQNYIKAKASSFNYLSQKVSETDPTIGLRLAEYAFSIDSLNSFILKNIRRIYFDNNFYKIVTRHTKSVNSVAFSPDGKTILTGSDDETARLCDLQGNILKFFKGHTDKINCLAFSPDGKNIITGSDDQTARLWDLNGNVIQVFKGHQDGVSAVAFSPNGKNILTGSLDNSAILWDLHGEPVQVFKGHRDAIYSVAFSPDGLKIITGSSDPSVLLWDLHGNVLHVFEKHEEMVSSVAFSPNGKYILTGSYDHTARLYDNKGNLIREIRAHEAAINTISFSPDSKSFLTGSWDKTARLWDLDGNELQIFKGHEGRILSGAFSPDGKIIITGSIDNTVRLWVLQEKAVKVFKCSATFVNSVAFSPDGLYILTGSSDNTATLWNLEANKLHVFKKFNGWENSITFSPDGKCFLVGSENYTPQLLDLHGNVLRVFKGHKAAINSVAFSSDGKRILTSSRDQTARLWDLKGNELLEIKKPDSDINKVSFSPDGKMILTGSDYSGACLWDLQGNKLLAFKGTQERTMATIFSPDGRNILTGSDDKTARLWDLKGNLLQVFTGHENIITSVAFSPDCKYIATGSVDNTARIWDLQGNVLQVFEGHNNLINAVTFSPDSKSILTAAGDYTARLWPLKKELKEFQKENAYQELSISQKIQYGIYDIANVLNLNDKESLYEAADYYSSEINSIEKNKKGEYIDEALKLYLKLLTSFKDSIYIARRDSLIKIKGEFEKPH